MNKLKRGIAPPPKKMAHLPIGKRGYPVPWFVSKIDGEWEFRVADLPKHRKAIKEKLCWVCGKKLGRYANFLIGPMCAVNRISSEPPCHRECALYSATNCPFLVKPSMVRREGGLPDERELVTAGIMIERNPGVALVWQTKKYDVFDDGNGAKLFKFEKPISTMWFKEGRLATRSEVESAIDSGLPSLLEAVTTEEELQMITDRIKKVMRMLPKLAA